MPSIASPALTPTPALPPRAEPAHPGVSAEALGWVWQQPALGPWRFAPALAGVLLAHLAGAWALMQLDPVRQALQQTLPLMVNLLPPPPAELPRPPLPAPRRMVPPPEPAPLLSAPPAPMPAPAVFEAPPVEAPEPAPVAVEAAPVAPEPSPPTPALEPKTVPATAVTWLQPPAPVYPALSQRRGEAGRVLLRVLIDVAGLPRQLQVQESSGFPRLDISALTAVRATRFKPYTEGGVPQPVWVLVPIVFESEK
ncbi:MAG TPA: energy transducer TonB [Burkholderiaceae bacterium]|nr:energy transducer TonB [Burkholderiaceae bacterium]